MGKLLAREVSLLGYFKLVLLGEMVNKLFNFRYMCNL